jgi:hypothetical protein
MLIIKINHFFLGSIKLKLDLFQKIEETIAFKLNSNLEKEEINGGSLDTIN